MGGRRRDTMSGTDSDPFYRTTLTLAQSGIRLQLRAGHGLFSGADVDLGTKLLLRTLIGDEHRSLTRVLDVGCGYGPIGLGLKALVPDRRVDLVDRDALAVEYALENARRNGLDGVSAYASLGYDGVSDRDFDLVVSNIPAKAGPAAIESLLLDAGQHLVPGGLAAVVVISRLEDLVAGVLERDATIEVVLRRERRGHTVFHYRFTRPPPAEARSGFERGVYERGRQEFSAGRVRWHAHTAYGLPEFDTLHYATELAVATLNRARRATRGERVLVVEPGQGHLAVVLAKTRRPLTVHLVSRDLLALRYAERNLAVNGSSDASLGTHHTARPPAVAGNVDLAVVCLLESSPQGVTDALLDGALASLEDGGRLVVAAGSTPVSRWVESSGRADRLTVVGRERRRGFSVLEVEAAS